MNIRRTIITDINEDLVFILYPFKTNSIIKDMSIHITNVGMVGLNPQPIIIINNNINAKLRYIVINVFKPRLPPISSKRINNIIDNTLIII